jgi:hypothetical protein
MVRGYVDGNVDRQTFQDWLDTNVQTTADSNESEAIELSDRAWILLSELGYGHRSESDVRAELKSALATIRR